MKNFLSLLFFLLLATTAFCAEKGGLWGGYAVCMKTGEVLYDQASEQNLVPASCLKLITTGVALQLFGPDKHFDTLLVQEGTVDARGVLHGNIYIVGGGDPCLASERIGSSVEQQLDLWIEAIVQAGIQEVEGRIIADASFWEETMAVPSWGWEDLGNYYGAGACALSFHENSYTLFIKAGTQLGDKTSIVAVEPEIPGLMLQNKVVTGERNSGDQACIYGAEYSPFRMVRGTIPLEADAFPIRGSIPDPALFVSQVLTKRMHEKGIQVLGKDLSSSQERKTIHIQESPSLARIVQETNRRSINLYAEHLLKALGKAFRGSGSTEEGIQVIQDFLEKKGIDCRGSHIADGSGLSRKNHLSPRLIVLFLQEMRRSPYWDVFYSSLVEKDNSKGKTGSMSFVRAYSGYKDDVAFSIISNNYDSNESDLIIDNFIKSIK